MMNGRIMSVQAITTTTVASGTSGFAPSDVPGRKTPRPVIAAIRAE